MRTLLGLKITVSGVQFTPWAPSPKFDFDFPGFFGGFFPHLPFRHAPGGERFGLSALPPSSAGR